MRERRLVGYMEEAALTDAVIVDESDKSRAELPEEIVIRLA